MTAGAGAPRARLGALAGAHRRALAAPLGAALARLDAALHGAVRRRRRRDVWLDPITPPVALWRPRTPGSSRSCTRLAGRERGAAEGPAQRARRARGAGAAGRPARPRRARAAARHRPRARARRAGRLARRRGRRAAGRARAAAGVHCFCVRATEPELPPSDRIAHLLLALRVDEEGFATVANHAFAGAPWRVRRRLPAADAPRARRRCGAASAAVALASRPWPTTS